MLDFLKDKKETTAIRNIRSRANKNWPRLMKDMFLTARFLEKEDLAHFLNDQIAEEEDMILVSKEKITQDETKKRTN